MRLENIVALTRATLLNEPVVTEFQAIVFDPEKVKRGDLFVAYTLDDLRIAIANGAYAVLFEQYFEVYDNEVAWIQVQSIKEALLRLLRFRLVEKNVTAYRCDEIVLAISFGIQTPSHVLSLRGDIKTLVQQLWNIEDSSILLFSPQQIDEALFTHVKDLPSTHKYTIDLIDKTLYEISFIFADTYYEQVALSPFFIPFLEILLNFYAVSSIPFTIKKFDHIEHFNVVFTNKNFEIKEHGSSEFVFVFEKNLDLLLTEMEFLKEHAPWAKTVVLLPSELDSHTCDICYTYSSEDEIFDILRNIDFHFALIGGKDEKILNNSKRNKQPKQLTFSF